MEGIAPDNIFNYNENNIRDNPGSKRVMVHRGKNRVERKTHFSKSSASVMFCRNATGSFLPPMVVNKSNTMYANIGEEVDQMEQFMMRPKVVGSITEHLLFLLCFSKFF